MKRIVLVVISIFLIVLMTGCAKTSTAAEKKKKETVMYKAEATADECFNWDGTEITGLTDAGREISDIVIPAKCTGFYAGAFENEQTIVSVKFASDKTTLARSLFCDCNAMKSIDLPNEIMEIPTHCFMNAGLSEVNIPETVTSIGSYSFYKNEELKEVDLSKTKIETIEQSTFAYCSQLQKVIMPDSITIVDEFAFDSCKNLSEITFSSALERIARRSFYSCDMLTNISLPTNLRELDSECFALCKNLIKVSLPDNLTLCDATAFTKATFEDDYKEVVLLINSGTTTDNLIKDMDLGNLVKTEIN